jgi:hypothetical protein
MNKASYSQDAQESGEDIRGVGESTADVRCERFLHDITPNASTMIK